MARIRSIKPGFFTSEQVCAVGSWARLLFAGLWTEADCLGVLEDRPKQIRMRLFPGDTAVDVDALLWDLAEVGLITRYTAPGGAEVLRIVGFRDHQKPHPKERPSGLPETGTARVRAGQPETGVTQPDLSTASREKVIDHPAVSWGREGKGTDPDPESEPRTPARETWPATLTRRRDLSAFWEGPIFNIPGKWASKALDASNGRLTDADLTTFARELHARVERNREDLTQLPNFLGWLDKELAAWSGRRRETRATDVLDARTQKHLAMVREAGGVS